MVTTKLINDKMVQYKAQLSGADLQPCGRY